VVDELEERYAEFNGLNLCYETREGILKHCSRHHAERLGELGHRFLERRQPSLEAQIANLADEIAYNNHDIDDGLRSGLLSLDQLLEVGIFARHHEAVMRRWPQLEKRRLVGEIIRSMINTLVIDLTGTTRDNLARHKPQSVDDVRAAPALAAFSPEVRKEADDLKRFLMRNLYRHWRVMRMTGKARRIVRELFTAFHEEPHLLSASHWCDDPVQQARAIADYIAGMTDRYAISEHRNLFQM